MSDKLTIGEMTGEIDRLKGEIDRLSRDGLDQAFSAADDSMQKLDMAEEIEQLRAALSDAADHLAGATGLTPGDKLMIADALEALLGITEQDIAETMPPHP